MFWIPADSPSPTHLTKWVCGFAQIRSGELGSVALFGGCCCLWGTGVEGIVVNVFEMSLS